LEGLCPSPGPSAEQPLASAARQLLASCGCVHTVIILLSVDITPPPVFLSPRSPVACHRRHASTGCMGRKAGPQTHDHDCQILTDLQNFFTGSFLDKFLKSVNIWQSCKQERMVVSCTLRAWPTYSVLLKDEESARDNHVLLVTLPNIHRLNFFHSQTRQ